MAYKKRRYPVVSNVNQLPDDILCNIFSLLRPGDSIRARLSSPRWLQLPDSRSVLQFDYPNVIGRRSAQKRGRTMLEAAFVRIVNRFMESWRGNKISKLIVCFGLGRQHSSDIDRWVATCIGMGVEEIQLDLSFGEDKHDYVFPCHTLCHGKAPYLKQLNLKGCAMRLTPQCTSWLCNLTSLELMYVPLCEQGLQLILLAGSNLISLTLISCSLPETLCVDGRLLSLKTLIIHDNDGRIKLDSQNLRVFEYYGRVRELSFMQVPVLREMVLMCDYQNPLRSANLFEHVVRNVPQLQELTFGIESMVRALRTTFAGCSLKRLNISAGTPHGYDTLCVTYMLNACPFLEIFQLRIHCQSYTKRSKKGEYPDHPHFHLKQVRIQRFMNYYNEMELAIYLLKNAVALEQMVIEVSKTSKDAKREAIKLPSIQKTLNPAAQVIIID